MASEVVKRRPGRPDKFDHQTTEKILVLLALNGGRYQETSRLVQEQLGLSITGEALANWATGKYASRYQQILSEESPKITESVLVQAEQTMLIAGMLERDLLAKLRQDMEDDKIKDVSSALRNVSTTKALQNDKIVGPLRGRPTAIVEHRDASEIIDKLQKLGIVDSTAEEIA